MCAIVMRDDVASPGSKAGSRVESNRQNMRDPIGSVGLVSSGGCQRGAAGADIQAEIGSRTASGSIGVAHGDHRLGPVRLSAVVAPLAISACRAASLARSCALISPVTMRCIGFWAAGDAVFLNVLGNQPVKLIHQWVLRNRSARVAQSAGRRLSVFAAARLAAHASYLRRGWRFSAQPTRCRGAGRPVHGLALADSATWPLTRYARRQRIALDFKQRRAPERPTQRPTREPFRQQQRKCASSCLHSPGRMTIAPALRCDAGNNFC